MSFEDIKGQDKAVQILKEHIKNSRLASAYLFVGPEGLGKYLVAKTLAKVLNCQTQSLDSCDSCPSCLKIEKNEHPDVHLISLADITEPVDSEAIKIEDIRQLQRDISLKPYEARTKVFIIDNAHNLTPEASNALLKILEEPPKNSLIILITAKPALLFKTIVSRCRVLKFYPLPRAELEKTLKENYSLDAKLSHFLAYFCEGRVGQTLKLKEKDLLSEKNQVIDEFVFSRKASLDDYSLKREDVRGRLNILAAWFRDIYLIKTGISHAQLINLDRKEELLRSMQHFSFTELDEILNSICASLFYLERNINVRLLLSNLKAQIWKS